MKSPLSIGSERFLNFTFLPSAVVTVVFTDFSFSALKLSTSRRKLIPSFFTLEREIWERLQLAASLA